MDYRGINFVTMNPLYDETLVFKTDNFNVQNKLDGRVYFGSYSRLLNNDLLYYKNVYSHLASRLFAARNSYRHKEYFVFIKRFNFLRDLSNGIFYTFFKPIVYLFNLFFTVHFELFLDFFICNFTLYWGYIWSYLLTLLTDYFLFGLFTRRMILSINKPKKLMLTKVSFFGIFISKSVILYFIKIQKFIFCIFKILLNFISYFNIFKNHYYLRMSTNLNNKSSVSFFNNDYCLISFSFDYFKKNNIKINFDNVSFLRLYNIMLFFYYNLYSFFRFKYFQVSAIKFLIPFFYLTIQQDKLGISLDVLYNKAYKLFTFFIMKKENFLLNADFSSFHNIFKYLYKPNKKHLVESYIMFDYSKSFLDNKFVWCFYWFFKDSSNFKFRNFFKTMIRSIQKEKYTYLHRTFFNNIVADSSLSYYFDYKFFRPIHSFYKLKREYKNKITLKNFFLHYQIRQKLYGILMLCGAKIKTFKILKQAFLYFKYNVQKVRSSRALIGCLQILKPFYNIFDLKRRKKVTVMFKPVRKNYQFFEALRMLKQAAFMRRTGLPGDDDATFSVSFAREIHDTCALIKCNSTRLHDTVVDNVKSLRFRQLNKSPFSMVSLNPNLTSAYSFFSKRLSVFYSYMMNKDNSSIGKVIETKKDPSLNEYLIKKLEVSNFNSSLKLDSLLKYKEQTDIENKISSSRSSYSISLLKKKLGSKYDPFYFQNKLKRQYDLMTKLGNRYDPNYYSNKENREIAMKERFGDKYDPNFADNKAKRDADFKERFGDKYDPNFADNKAKRDADFKERFGDKYDPNFAANKAKRDADFKSRFGDKYDPNFAANKAKRAADFKARFGDKYDPNFAANKAKREAEMKARFGDKYDPNFAANMAKRKSQDTNTKSKK